MIAAVAHKTPGIILNKLTLLLLLLQEVKNLYEKVAQSDMNNQMRLSILGLAQESKQYANELIAHIETLGGKLNVSEKTACNDLHSFMQEGFKMPGILTQLSSLKSGEQQLMKTYRDVLNEPYLYDTIRQMLRYQQNGLLHCFSQIRMLYAALLGSPASY